MSVRYPQIIQGGMGIAVSDWKLARTVALMGEMGVVSGTAINSVLVRRLQDGDVGGHMRRALQAFPSQEIAAKILETYFIDGGRAKGVAYKRSQLFSLTPPLALSQLTVVASFVEVYLAKEGHDGLVGFNLLEKVHLPNLACLYGAVLAGVDAVLMGAGIPREIPGVLDLLSQNKTATLKVPVVGSSEDAVMSFDPSIVMAGCLPDGLKRPHFYPIVSSSVLAQSLKKKSTGEVNGFIVEGPLAGGHNAPPRGPMRLNEAGEPIYGPRDEVDLAEMKALELPFWIAGHAATPEKLAAAVAAGAAGIQVGTLFAFAEESGLDLRLKSEVVGRIARGENPKDGWVFTDPVSSPTGFPFKAVRLSGSVSESEVYLQRKRICDLGYLRHLYQKTPGEVGYRCSAEPVVDFEKKGGLAADTVGKKCLCNALMADIGMGQVQSWGEELPLLTAGDDLNFLSRVLAGRDHYSAADVIRYLRQAVADVTVRPMAEAVSV
ncbi:MAG: nitronate monooxygenase [Bdellovibrionales bacterium]|nr:nitronate monooxygenase [Bdellovibrionales bacterium]